MAPTGKAILRSLQNDTLPIVDLVVRESFQNSLDATLPDADMTKIDVDINRIKTTNIAKHFELVDKQLLRKFPEDSLMMSISDRNTTGLRGVIDSTDGDKLNDSNIYKLIYGINMNQERGDAGGSWGLGKTSFFRIGSGIVIYYTRIKLDNGQYEERLAACLIEDSSAKDPLLPENDRGIAWWGERQSKLIGTFNHTGKTIPITDKKKIYKFLSDFNLEPYREKETGTRIIIPFIDESKLVVKEEGSKHYYWDNHLNDSVTQAIQRWYFPRIMNEKYQNVLENSMLLPRVNGKTITPIVFSPTYDWFYKIYTSALIGKSQDKQINVKPIYLKQMGMKDTSTPIGHVAYVVLNRNQLKMTPPDNRHSPLAYIGEQEKNNQNGVKIMGYCRKPGMVIEYDIGDSDWLKSVPVEENQFVLAFFVPNSDEKMHSRYQSTYNVLENYLRDTEQADHASWKDIIRGSRKITIVSRTKKEVNKAITDELIEAAPTVTSSRTSALGRKFGKQVLPGSNFGQSAHRKTTNKKQSTQRGKRNPGISVDSYHPIDNTTIEISYTVQIPKDSESKIHIVVDAVDANINEKKWLSTFGSRFPFEIDQHKINIDNKNIEYIDIDKKAGFALRNTANSLQTVSSTIVLNIHDVTMTPKLLVKQNNKG